MSWACRRGYCDPPEREVGEGITGSSCELTITATETSTHSKIVFDIVIGVVEHVGGAACEALEWPRDTGKLGAEIIPFLECLPGPIQSTTSTRPLADAMTSDAFLASFPFSLMFHRPSFSPDNARTAHRDVRGTPPATDDRESDDEAMYPTASPPPDESVLRRAGYSFLSLSNSPA